MSGIEVPHLSTPPNKPGAREPDDAAGPLARFAGRVTDLAERWVPDAFVFALVATAVSIIAALGLTPTSPMQIVDAWGGGFWKLLPFAMQMSLVIITGYVLATTKPVYRLIARLASVPKTPRTAVAWVAVFAMASAWFNWGFSLIFSAMLAREVARRLASVDYRAVAASAFLGLGSVWAQGLSGSAALQMATPSALPESIRQIVAHRDHIPGGIISLDHTIFLWQSLASVFIEVIVVTAAVYLYAPSRAKSRTAKQMNIDLGVSPLERPDPPVRGTPGEWLEHSRILTAVFVALAGVYLVHRLSTSSKGLASLDLNSINLVLLTLGFALHGTPAKLMRAVKEATPGVWGVILQFPLYAGIAGIIVKTHLNERIAAVFVSVSNHDTFPAVVSLYSTFLGIFVPSGGSKWVIEAPYVMKAAHDLHVHLGWTVAVYDLGEAIANLVQPFWMLPVLGLFGLRAKDIMGYTFLVFLVLLPVVLLMVTLFGTTLSYPL